MNSDVMTQVFLGLATISLGTFLGALGNKLASINSQTNWKWVFYGLGILSIISSMLYFFFFAESNFISYLTLVLLFVSGGFLLVYTWKVLDKKFIYKTSELDPIINNFTSHSDKTEIKLFGGDLNFFGNIPVEMDQNDQYIKLKIFGFRKTLVLCEEPRNLSTKIRYGKILHEIKGTEMRFYNPDEADLSIRGRMKTINGVEKLMIYTKIEPKKYQTIETDTANSNGALYNNIWKLVWSLANNISKQQESEYINLFISN